MATLEEIIFLVITVLLLAIFLYIGDKIFGNRRVELTSGYYINAIITAIVIIVLIIGISAVIAEVDILGIGQIAPILVFVAGCYAIRGLLMKGASYERAVWVGVIAWLCVYVCNYISDQLFDTPLVEYI
ncbi:MAG: hypothetical protein ACXAD7_01945 [Candidatus Kariarchaeaceae archaeon]|jgi:hypothetical protein